MKQQGSAHVVVVTVLSVALIGALGYIFWNNIIKPKDSASTANSTSSPKDDKQASASPKTEVASNSNANQLDIKEWGITLKTSTAAKLNYTYTKKDVSAEDNPLYSQGYDSYIVPTIKSQYLDNKSCSGLGVTLSRSSEISKGSTSTNIVKVGNYYYFITGSPALCPDGSDKDNELYRSIMQDFDTKNLTVM